MIDKANILELSNAGLKGTDKFPVDVQIKGNNIITILIDGDTGVTIEDCIRLSKHIEANLDRDAEDFELRVSSFGADKPLKMKRQYKKNVGRELKVTLVDDTLITGKLDSMTDNFVTIKPKGDKKKGGKVEAINIDFDEIKEASVVLSFK